MKPGRIQLAAMVVVFAVQLAVPGWTIVSRERALAAGESFRFKTAIVDPYDAFRGRYVRVGLLHATVETGPAEKRFLRETTAYASIAVDPDGFARFSAVALEPPAAGPFMKVRARQAGGTAVLVIPPFDRYFMNERLAPEAERIYRQHSGKNGDAWLSVAVRDGKATIEGLFIGTQSIEDYVRRSEDQP